MFGKTLLLYLSLLVCCGVANSQSILVVTETGDAVPDNDGVFDNLSAPLLGDSGRASFFSFVQGATGYDGLFVVDGDAIRTVAREGEAAPGSSAFYLTFPFSARGVNDSGNLVFRSDLVDGDSGEGIFVGNGLGTIGVALEGASMPGGGSFLNFGTPSINEKNQVAFDGCFTLGMYFFDPSGELIEIAEAGDQTPDGNFFSSFRRPLLNEQQQMVFYAEASTAAGDGIYLADLNDISTVVILQDDAPGGDGQFDSLSEFPSINEVGEVVFHASLVGTQSGDVDGLYLFDGSTLSEIARTDQMVPSNSGTFASFGNSNLPIINDLGQVAFTSLINGAGSMNGSAAIFLYSNGSVSELVSLDTDIEGGAIVGFDDIALNNNGQIAFSASIDVGGPEPVEGIFFWCPELGLVEAIRQTDSFLGSTIASLSFPTGMQHNGDEKSGFNNLGQIAFNVELEDQREAIAIWSPPFVLGDLNGDCQVSLLDVAPFVTLLQAGEFAAEADINGDGVLDLLDVGPFVNLLSGQ